MAAADPAADVRAAAAVGHYLIAGPVGPDPQPVCEVRPDVPAAVASALDRTLDRETGFADAAAFRQALHDGLGDPSADPTTAKPADS